MRDICSRAALIARTGPADAPVLSIWDGWSIRTRNYFENPKDIRGFAEIWGNDCPSSNRPDIAPMLAHRRCVRISIENVPNPGSVIPTSRQHPAYFQIHAFTQNGNSCNRNCATSVSITIYPPIPPPPLKYLSPATPFPSPSPSFTLFYPPHIFLSTPNSTHLVGRDTMTAPNEETPLLAANTVSATKPGSEVATAVSPPSQGSQTQGIGGKANADGTSEPIKRTLLPWAQFSIISFLQLVEPLTGQVIYPVSSPFGLSDPSLKRLVFP